MFDKLLDEFMPEVSLREYLKQEPAFYNYKMADVIFYSREPLSKKLEALKALESMELPENNKDLMDYRLRMRRSIESAFSLINTEDAVFIVNEYLLGIDDDDDDPDEWMHGVFASYDAAMSFVKKDSEEKKMMKT